MRTRYTFVAAAFLIAATSLTAAAQDRMPPIPREKMTEAQKRAVDDFAAARGTAISGPFIPLLRSPEVLTRARVLSDYLRFKSALPPRLSEFVILMTARYFSQQYEWNAHAPLALKAGLSGDIVQAVSEGRRPDSMADDEEVVYALCDELRRTHSVSDPTYSRAVLKLGEQGVIDTIGLMGYYSLIAMVLNTARTPLPEGAKPALATFPR